MKSCEPLISPESEYFVYSPSCSAQEIFFYPLQCGHFLYEPGYCLQRESFDSFLLMYIQRGSLSLTLKEETFFVPKGSFVLLNCYQRHSYFSSESWECLWCHFDGVLARPFYERIHGHMGTVFSLTDPLPVLRKLTAIYETFFKGKLVREPLLSQYLTDILTTFLLHSPADEKTCRHQSLTEEAITYINEHFREAITVEELAKLSGLSQYHFIRIFKKETGFTPHEYLINIRLGTARYLLKNTSLPIKDICFDSGFSCESVFCSAFRHREGMTPVQYRMLSSDALP